MSRLEATYKTFVNQPPPNYRAHLFYHALLLVCALAEIFELETVLSLRMNQLVDGLVILGFGVAIQQIFKSSAITIATLSLAIIPYALDVLAVSTGQFDVQAFLWGVFHLVLLSLLGHRAMRRPEVLAQDLVDAVNIYVMAGIAFGNLYAMIQTAVPGALSYHGGQEPVSFGLIIYYSFMTQTTIGFGDILPTETFCRAVSIMQGIFGVLYIAVTIGRLVGLYANGQRSTTH